jgi:hypothetical protein
MPKLIRNLTIITAMLIIMTLGISSTAYAQPPLMPQQFYGAVSINNQRAEAGNVVSIKIDGEQKASVNTDSNGRYGYNPLITVTGTNGALVEFYINGVKAQQVATYSSGAITKVDLSVGAQMPPPSPPPSQPAPSLPEDENDTGSQTQTQSQTTTTSSTTTINTNIMGQPGSFSINSGNVLTENKVFASADNNFKISMQADTVVNIQGQSLSASVDTSPPAAPDNTELLSAYKIEPSGSTFDPALIISVTYDNSDLPQGISGSGLYIAYWNNTQWINLSSTVDLQNNTVTARTTHFTIFGLFGSVSQQTQASQPAIAINSLSISPMTVSPQEEVTISAEISNNGNAEGDYKAVLNINGINEASKSITLAPDDTQTVTFTTAKENAGKYEVAVGDRTGSFTVTAGKSSSNGIPATLFGLPIVIVGVIALAILLIIILIVVSARKRAS